MPPPNPERLSSSKVYNGYALAGILGGDVDLVADGGGICRMISCATAGNLVVTRPDGTNVTIPFAAGQTQPICAKALVAASSTVTGIAVLW